MTKKGSSTKRPPSFADRGRLGGKARLRTMSSSERRQSAQHAVMARWQKTTKEQRREIARKAVQARWARVKPQRTTGL